MTTDGFQKYVPPHMRKRGKQRRNKNNKNNNININIESTEVFPELVDKSFTVEKNNDWINESKINTAYSKDEPIVNEYFKLGNMNYKMDKDIKKGWIILNKNNELNRGNCECCDCCSLKSIERENEIENYWYMQSLLSRNSDGIPLIPIKSFNYDTEDEEETEDDEDDELEEKEINELVVEYDSQSDFEDY